MLIQSMCAVLLGICVHFNEDEVPNYTKEKLCALIENRIGMERFQDAIGGVTRHEIYSRTIKHPQPAVKSPGDLLLDHEFCRLLKRIEGTILETVLKGSGGHGESSVASLSVGETKLVGRYKDVIREQDVQIRELKGQNEGLVRERVEMEGRVKELEGLVGNLRDQNLVLRAAQSDSNSKVNGEKGSDEVEAMRRRVQELEERLAECLTDVKGREGTEGERLTEVERELRERTEELEKVKKDQDDLLELLADQDSKIAGYKERLAALGEKVESEDSSGEADTDDQPESSN